MPQISVARAVLIGTLIVNGPVFALLAVGVVVATLLTPQIGNWAVVALVIGFALAWLWWSLTVPHWRLWAYARVASIAELKSRAIAVGLTWPDGSLFARTEIKSKDHAARERAFERDRA